MKPNINPNNELFKWGPIDGRPMYIDYWYYGMKATAKRYKSWPSFLVHIANERIFYVCEYQPLRDTGEENFRRFILDDKKFRQTWEEWRKDVDDLAEFLSTITTERLHKASKEELFGLFDKLEKRYTNFWTVGLLPEIANFGGEQLLKRKLEKHLHANDVIHTFERLSAPEDYSFYQIEELDLLKVKTGEQTLEKHQQQFFWMLNSYHDTKILPIEYFQKGLDKMTLKDAKQKIKAIEFYKEETAKEKEEIIKRFKLGKEIEKMAQSLSFCIWWQDNRKKYVFIVNHYIDMFLNEISQRFQIDNHELHYYQVADTNELLKHNKKLSKAEISKRLSNFLKYYDEESNNVQLFTGKEAQKIIEPFYAIKIDQNQKEFKGMVVSKGNGNITGTVKIIHSPKDAHKMNKNDILVASMTSPDYIIAMRKARAIITDEGGMTAHAAIVSRELGIPCICATRIATKLLKDGDRVEINVKQGIVKRLK